MTDLQRAYFICMMTLIVSTHGPWWYRVMRSRPDMRIVRELVEKRE